LRHKNQIKKLYPSLKEKIITVAMSVNMTEIKRVSPDFVNTFKRK